jgi:hypothetical protein
MQTFPRRVRMLSLLKRVLALPVVVGTAAAVAGYVVLALTSQLVQGVWLGGVSYRDSSLQVLVLAGIFTPVCGLLAGFVVAKVGRQVGMQAAVAVSLMVAVETTYLYLTRRVDGPLWFEAGAGATVAIAVLLGAWLGAPKVGRRAR